MNKSLDFVIISCCMLGEYISKLKHPNYNKKFTLTDVLTLLFLMFFGFLSRTFRIQYPEARIFDEIYFGNFTNYYLTNQYFFDIHPPFAKLIFAFFAKLSLDPATTNYHEAIEGFKTKYYVTLRMTAATFSSLVAPYGFATLRIFGYSYISSLFAGFYLSIEFMLIVEGRQIFTDGILHSFVMLAIMLIAVLHTSEESISALVVAGIGCGCCSSIKFTALSIYAIVALHQLLYITGGNVLKILDGFYIRKSSFKDFFTNNILGKYIFSMSIIVFTGFFVTISLFCIHVILLIYPSNRSHAVPDCFNGTLLPLGTTDFYDHVKGSSLLKRVFSLIYLMHAHNMRITGEHSAQSFWYQWPFVLMKSIPYYTNNMSLVLTPNFLVWYSAVLGAFLGLALSIAAFWYKNWNLLQISIWPFAYFSSWLPFALVPRILYVYHYLIPLMFGVLSFATFIDVAFQNHRVVSSCLFTLLIISGFILWIYYTPWLYAMSGYDWDSRKWYKNFF